MIRFDPDRVRLREADSLQTIRAQLQQLEVDEKGRSKNTETKLTLLEKERRLLSDYYEVNKEAGVDAL